jgi:hypothetical protein
MYTGTWTASGVGNVNYTSSNVNSNITVSTGSDYLQVYESGVYEVCLEATVEVTSGEYFLLYTNMSGTGPYIDVDTGGTLQKGTYRSCVFKSLTTDTIYTEYNSNGAAVTRVSISAKRIN